MSYMHKVLLIEDDEFTRFMMREIISGLGVEVEIASGVNVRVLKHTIQQVRNKTEPAS